jgi:spermidine synthase
LKALPGHNPRARLAILSGALFLSGASALLFETLWLRLSGLAFGNSVWSAALILSSFMAGLGLGNAIAATLKLWRHRPLQVYAALEIAIAVFGCTIIFALPLLGQWLRPIFHLLWDHDGILNGLRFFLSFLILLLPTTAMGLTLPVLLGDPVLQRRDFAQTIGIFYGANTLGAVAGALMGEAFLIAAVGLYGTSLIAGFFNCLAAAAAWFLYRGDKIDSEIAAERTTHLRLDYQLPRKLLLVSFGTGFLLLSLEVVWFRFLRLYVASSATAFSIMLAVVLAGIGSGGLVAGAFHRRLARPNYFIPILLLLSAIATLLAYWFFPGAALQERTGAFYLDARSEIWLLSLALMFPAAFLSGLLFPSIAARVQERVGDRMNSTGITTMFNTAGAALGPLLAGFVLLPGIGFERSLLLCAAIYAILALVASERSIWDITRRPGLAMVALYAAAILMIAFFPYHRDEEHLANARRPFEQDGEHLVRKIEGTADTLQLLRRDFFGQPYYFRLLTNAFSMSATTPKSQRYMRLFAYLPLALRPESEDALLVCYGLGATADALMRAPHLKRVEMVDLSKEVFALANDQSGADYSNPLRAPRARSFAQDGRFFLQATPRQYDIITGEPPPPKIAGAVNLYTEQFFALVKSRLKENGIVTFWLPIYQLRVGEVKSILRAFHDVFPNASLWAGPDEEWIMMGINGPGRKVAAEEMRRLWENAATKTDLARIGLEVPEQLAALFLIDGEEIERLTHNAKPLTDFFPKRLSDVPADLKAIDEFAWIYMEASPAARRFRSSPLIRRIWPDELMPTAEPFFIVREERFLSLLKTPNPFAQIDFYMRRTKLRAPLLEVLRSSEFRVAIVERLAPTWDNPPPDALWDLMAGAVARRDIPLALQILELKRTLARPPTNEILLLIYLYCVNGDVEKAEALARSDAASVPKDSLVDWLWGKLRAEYGFHPPP